MYNTPMYYKDEPKSAPLHAIHLIQHASENWMEPMSGASAVSNIMAFCIQNNYDASLIDNNLDFILGMVEAIPVFKTGFVPELSAVKYINDHEN
jgi:hypothetical protein